MAQPVPALRHAIAVVDVEGFSDPARSELHQDAVRRGLYEALDVAFCEAGTDMTACTVEDRGDGAVILVPPTVPERLLVDQFPRRLVSALLRHNAVAAHLATIRLRLALHAGPVRFDARGLGGAAVIHTFRLADADVLKTALRESAGVLAMIVSDDLYRTVVAPDAGAEPQQFRRVDVHVKHTAAAAWLRTFDHAPVALRQQASPEKLLSSVVDELLAVPTLRTEDGRRTLLELLRPEIANAVPYNPRPRLHVVNLVRTCLDYERGVPELLEILRELEGDSLPVRRLAETLRHWLSE